MLRTRVIPILLLKNRGLYKGVRFKNHRYIGDPINIVKIFNEKEVDELVFLDIVATREKKDPDYALIKDMASEAFMPLAYGGGVHSIDHASRLFQLGIEKVVLNTAAVENPELITQISSSYGSQSVVVCVDVKKNWLRRRDYIATHSGSKLHKIDLIKFVREMQSRGAGEIILNSIDCDGTMLGYNLSLIKSLSSIVDIPLIAVGGCGNLMDLKEAKLAGASAVGVGAFFVFQGTNKAVLISYPNPQMVQGILK